MRQVDPRVVEHYIPDVDGFHGSKILWESVEGYEDHWNSLGNFLNRVV